jgi:hypothetical protein
VEHVETPAHSENTVKVDNVFVTVLNQVVEIFAQIFHSTETIAELVEQFVLPINSAIMDPAQHVQLD